MAIIDETFIKIEIHKLREISRLLTNLKELINKNHKISGDLRNKILIDILDISIILDEEYKKRG